MAGLKKKAFGAKESNSDYKDTMMKLKNYWPQSTIELYMAKAISLHDMDSWVDTEKKMADINQVILNMDEWHKKNPEYSFMTATKILKEKANISTPNAENIVESYERNPFYRTRSRYERAMENDQYYRGNPEPEEDDEMVHEILHTEASRSGLVMPNEMPDEDRGSEVRAVRASTSFTIDPETSSRWNTLFGESVGAETPVAPSNAAIRRTFQGVTPDGDMVSLTYQGGSVYIGTDQNGSLWLYNEETAVWSRR